MLELPHLGRVPRTWTVHRKGRLSARTALALLELGHLRPEAGDRPAGEIINTGLRTWLDGQTEQLRLFGFQVHYSEGPDPLAPEGAEIRFMAPMRREVIVGAKLTLLERRFTGLGSAALEAIDRASDITVPIFTPSNALHWARKLYWKGKRDELGLSPRWRQDVLKRSAFDRSLPTWASEPSGSLPDANLRSMALNSRKLTPRWAGQVALATLALRETVREATKEIDRGALPNLPVTHLALILKWAPNDVTRAILDDRYQFFREQEQNLECFAFGALADDADCAADLKEMLTGLEPVFRVLRSVEVLVQYLMGKPNGE